MGFARITRCRVQTNNCQHAPVVESTQFMLGILSQPSDTLFGSIILYLMEILSEEILRKVGIWNPTDSVWPLLARVLS